jgi:hypothetical protein
MVAVLCWSKEPRVLASGSAHANEFLADGPLADWIAVDFDRCIVFG